MNQQVVNKYLHLPLSMLLRELELISKCNINLQVTYLVILHPFFLSLPFLFFCLPSSLCLSLCLSLSLSGLGLSLSLCLFFPCHSSYIWTTVTWQTFLFSFCFEDDVSVNYKRFMISEKNSRLRLDFVCHFETNLTTLPFLHLTFIYRQKGERAGG